MKVSLSLCSTGQVSRSALKQPRSCNIFKALFCCLQAQDGPKPPPPTPPPSQQALLESQENGTVVKVTPFLFQQCFTPLKTIWRPQFSPAFIFVYLTFHFLVAPTHTHTHTARHKRGGVWIVWPSVGINQTCCCKNVLIIDFKHYFILQLRIKTTTAPALNILKANRNCLRIWNHFDVHAWSSKEDKNDGAAINP